MNQRTQRLGSDPTHRILLRLALPAISSLLINATYNVVDSLFVGRFVGTDGLAAVGLNFPLQIFLISVGILVGVGGSALISRRLGEGDATGADRAFGSSLGLILMFGVGIVVIGAPLAAPLVRAFGASRQVFPLARSYFAIIALGAPTLIANQALNNFVYAEGNATVGFAALAFSSVLNIFLDWLFIAGFGWGVAGAAWATVISQGVATVAMLAYFALPASNLRMNLCYCREDLIEVIRIGFSASIRTLTVVALALVVNRQAAQVQGDLGIAVASVVFRVVSIVVLPAFGINQAYLPVAAYSYGAKSYGRVLSATWQAIAMALLVCFSASALVSVFSIPLAQLFNPDPEFVATAARGFRIAFLLTPLIIFNLVGGGLFQAVGDARRALLVSISRMAFFILPLMLILPSYYGLLGIWMSFPIGESLSATFSTIVSWPQLRRLTATPR